MEPINFEEKMLSNYKHKLRTKLPMLHAGELLQDVATSTYAYIDVASRAMVAPVPREEALDAIASVYMNLCLTDIRAHKPLRYCVVSWGDVDRLTIAVVQLIADKLSHIEVFPALLWWKSLSSELYKTAKLDEALLYRWPDEPVRNVSEDYYWDRMRGYTKKRKVSK
jgi:hypothetical protein